MDGKAAGESFPRLVVEREGRKEPRAKISIRSEEVTRTSADVTQGQY